MPKYTPVPGVKPGKTYQWVTYLQGTAFTFCDCGAELTLAEQIFNSRLYLGQCPNCKKSFELKDGFLREVKENPQPQTPNPKP